MFTFLPGGGTLKESEEPGDPQRATRIDRTDKGTTMSEQTVYGAAETKPRTKVRTHHLHKWKSEGHKWAMLTAYDYSTARVFDDAGIPVLLVGDSAANVVYGYDTTVPVTIDELIPLVRGVVRGAQRAPRPSRNAQRESRNTPGAPRPCGTRNANRAPRTAARATTRARCSARAVAASCSSLRNV